VRVTFFASDKQREQDLGQAFIDGVRKHGDDGCVNALNGEAQTADDSEAAIFVGVKSRELYAANRAAGIHTVMIDKGYSRHRIEGTRIWEYWRVAVNGHHPTRYLGEALPHDRLKLLNIELMPWHERGKHILICGSSAKYHQFYGLVDPTTYAEGLVAEIRSHTDMPIYYRPKPSWKDAREIRGAKWSPGGRTLDLYLRAAAVMVTHGSNACFEAVCAGVPCIITGDAVAKPISSTAVADINGPYLATDRQRRQWLANLAYQQWTMLEFRTGEAWATIRQQIDR